MSTPLLPHSSALAEATPDSLGDLFSRDPETCTPEDDAKIVAILREQRARYQLAEATGAKVPRLARAAAPPVEVEDPDTLPI